MVKEKYLNLTGINGRTIQNTFWANADNPQKLAILFTGYRYPGEAPVFHFLKLHFMAKGWAVLTIEYRYNEDEAFLMLPDSEQENYIHTEALLMKKQFETALAFKQYCLIGKSLGTTMLFKIIENGSPFIENDVNQFVWLTPAESNEKIAEYIIEKSLNSIYVIGSDDPFYNETILTKLKEQPSCKCNILPNAGHIFNYKQDVGLTMGNNVAVVEYLMKKIKL